MPEPLKRIEHEIHSPLQLLRTIRDEILTDPSRWCKGSLALDQNEEICLELDHVCRVCLVGALRFAQLNRRDDGLNFLTLQVLHSTLYEQFPEYDGKALQQFNDSASTTFEDVRKVLDRAIEREIENA